MVLVIYLYFFMKTLKLNYLDYYYVIIKKNLQIDLNKTIYLVLTNKFEGEFTRYHNIFGP